ncbi:type I-F CRISPR-associated endonuclease Cas1f [Hydrogenimonas sp. SS33]|uniref:type I-F CRISPR-associated endonuclease Cas1f n=1 Tax=Hydrogenimonas leucolamina TaxID=2954236 RepID=UPI00336BBEF6
MQKDGRVVYLSEEYKEYRYWNIPIANTTCLLLGTGTSITQAAMRMLSQAGVLVGFCGGGATPLFAGVEIEWLTPQNEYRPTEYVQRWLSFWFDESKRLDAAKYLENERLNYICSVWRKDRTFKMEGFDSDSIEKMIDLYREKISEASSIGKLLQLEADLTKRLYKHAANITGLSGFSRQRSHADPANDFLDHGNYLAYGLAATALWALGIPHAFALMHGKTRRGALVFDIADLAKDAIVLPNAFIGAKEGIEDREFRARCLQSFVEHGALNFMFDQVQNIAIHYGIKP